MVSQISSFLKISHGSQIFSRAPKTSPVSPLKLVSLSPSLSSITFFFSLPLLPIPPLLVPFSFLLKSPLKPKASPFFSHTPPSYNHMLMPLVLHVTASALGLGVFARGSLSVAQLRLSLSSWEPLHPYSAFSLPLSLPFCSWSSCLFVVQQNQRRGSLCLEFRGLWGWAGPWADRNAVAISGPHRIKGGWAFSLYGDWIVNWGFWIKWDSQGFNFWFYWIGWTWISEKWKLGISGTKKHRVLGFFLSFLFFIFYFLIIITTTTNPNFVKKKKKLKNWR